MTNKNIKVTDTDDQSKNLISHPGDGECTVRDDRASLIIYRRVGFHSVRIKLIYRTVIKHSSDESSTSRSTLEPGEKSAEESDKSPWEAPSDPSVENGHRRPIELSTVFNLKMAGKTRWKNWLLIIRFYDFFRFWWHFTSRLLYWDKSKKRRGL